MDFWVSPSGLHALGGQYQGLGEGPLLKAEGQVRYGEGSAQSARLDGTVTGSPLGTCLASWRGVFERFAADAVGVGGKFHTTANLVFRTDVDAAAPYREVEVPGATRGAGKMEGL